MFQVAAALAWFTRRPITIRACNCLAKSNFFTTCEVPVWDPVCYTQSMSLKSFDHSLFTNLSFRHLFRGMSHGYELILSRIISRAILRRTRCTCDDYLLNTSLLLDCTYLLSANPFSKKSHLKKGWKATASGPHLFHSKFWYLPPLLGVGRNGEGWEREKKGKYWAGGYPRMAGKKMLDSFRWF